MKGIVENTEEEVTPLDLKREIINLTIKMTEIFLGEGKLFKKF